MLHLLPCTSVGHPAARVVVSDPHFLIASLQAAAKADSPRSEGAAPSTDMEGTSCPKQVCA